MIAIIVGFCFLVGLKVFLNTVSEIGLVASLAVGVVIGGGIFFVYLTGSLILAIFS